MRPTIRSDWSPATRPTRAPKPRLRKLRVSSPRERSFATRTQVSGGRSRRPTSPFCFEPATRHREFEAALDRARHRRICLQRPRFLRRRRNQGRARAALGTSPIRCRISAPRRCCDRASCGSRTRRLRPARAEPRRVIARRRRRRLSISIRPTPRRWRRHASHARGGEALVDRLPPAELLDLVLDRVGVFRARCAARGFAAGAREPEEDARADTTHPEPRLRDARPHRRSPRPARRRRRIQCGDRRARRREPDDGPRLEGTRVSDRLPRQSRARDRQLP